MRLTAFFVLFLLYFSLAANAQKNDIQVAIGYNNSALWSAGLGYFTYEPANKPSSYYISYKYHFTKTTSFGLTVGTFSDQGIYYYNADHGRHSESIATYTRSSVIISPEVSLTYSKTKYFSVYAVFGLGLRISKVNFNYHAYQNNQYTAQYDTTYTEGTKLVPVLQITPLAFRFGDNIGGTIELGLGYKGLLNFGFFCKF